ncbi:hypothetical protein G5C60_32945 [Streptomyces sp. HC44]|uniref:Secreted protein n=1 Tax=Streptomyces scabichelini TaxID=2711217 RepID=A0A6G4VDW7_9ACTN|nr:hypothetical protein [Streptomyces scabichelini]NGO12289.1 hypothetical protein [Streptomyces scabichelini]
MRRVRELAAAAGALAAALALVLTGAPTAVAGGPTSVLLVSPNSGETASLYNSDEGYMRLRDLLPEEGRELDKAQEKPPDLKSIGRRINVTWLIHDVTPWRVDMVHPDVAGSRGVWILTQLRIQRDGSKPPEEIWHRAKNPDELRGLLTDLGVMSKHPEGTNPDSGPKEPSDDTSAAAPAGAGEPPVTAAAAGTDDGTDWWWAIPGLVAGAVLALVLRPFAARLPGALPLGRGRERDVGPRQELRDV